MRPEFGTHMTCVTFDHSLIPNKVDRINLLEENADIGIQYYVSFGRGGRFIKIWFTELNVSVVKAYMYRWMTRINTPIGAVMENKICEYHV